MDYVLCKVEKVFIGALAKLLGRATHRLSMSVLTFEWNGATLAAKVFVKLYSWDFLLNWQHIPILLNICKNNRLSHKFLGTFMWLVVTMDTNSVFRKAIDGFYNGNSGLSAVQTEVEEIFEDLNIPRPSRDITVNGVLYFVSIWNTIQYNIIPHRWRDKKKK